MSVRVDVAALSATCVGLLEHAGLSRVHAGIIAACLVNADLWGVESHGVSRLPIYLERLGRKAVNPSPHPRLLSAEGAATTLDGDNGPGAVVGTVAMQAAIERAKKFGSGIVVARNSNHYGVAGHYARMAVPERCIGLSGSNAPITMAVWGARTPALGTNPLAVALPAGRHGCFALDMSSSVVAKGRILLAKRRQEPIPSGWALDASGRATTDASAAWEGVVLPFAGPKGSGMAMFIEAIAGALSGAAMASAIQDQYTVFDRPQNVGHFFIVLNIAAFMPPDEFESRMEALVDELKACEKAEGFSEILIPGEAEARCEARCRAEGIPMDGSLLEQLSTLCRQVGIPPPATRG